MSRKQVAILIVVVLSLSGVALVFWGDGAANQGVRVQFVGVTNVPGQGPRALLIISNLTPALIICQGVGYLQPGDSEVGLLGIPAGTGPWRASVRWQRRDFTALEMLVNKWHDQLLVAFGQPQYHRDPWVPFNRLSYSDEIQR
jgi:hypothetical protein